MKLLEEINLNKFGQSISKHNDLLEYFRCLPINEQRTYLEGLADLIIQSNPVNSDIEQAIDESCLKYTFTPCVIINKGITINNLIKLSNLPHNELNKSFLLMIYLFKMAYRRRFNDEKHRPNKWWYWDLSDPNNIEIITKNFKY